MLMINTYNMFCLPPAGSSCAIYASWKRLAVDTLSKAHITVIPVEYSGHGSKSDQPLIDNPQILASDIAQTIMTYRDVPYILFGHSVGGALLWTVIECLRAAGAAEQLTLIVVSSRPEHQHLQHIRGRHKLTDEALIHRLQGYNNFPNEILQNKAALRYFLRIIRNDFSLSDQLIDSQITKTTVPLVTFCGANDPDIPTQLMMQDWQQHTEKFLGCHILQGDHFYFLNQHSLRQLLKTIEACLMHETYV